VCMLPPFERRADSLRQTLLPIAIAVAVAFVEMWLAGLLREALVALVTRLAS